MFKIVSEWNLNEKLVRLLMLYMKSHIENEKNVKLLITCWLMHLILVSNKFKPINVFLGGNLVNTALFCKVRNEISKR